MAYANRGNTSSTVSLGVVQREGGSARGSLKAGLRGQSFDAQVQCLRPVQRKPTDKGPDKVDALPANATLDQIDTYIDTLPGWLYKGRRGETFYRNLVRRLSMERAQEDGERETSPVLVDDEVVQQEHFRTFVMFGTTVFRQTFASDVGAAFRHLVGINTEQGRMDWQLIANALLMVPSAIAQRQTPLQPGAFGTRTPEQPSALPRTPGARDAMVPPEPAGGGRPGNGTMGTTPSTPGGGAVDPHAPTLPAGGSRAPTMVAPTMVAPTMVAPTMLDVRGPTVPAPGR